jgi:hypothetical protein
VAAPGFDQNLGLLQGAEDLAVEGIKLIARLTRDFIRECG